MGMSDIKTFISCSKCGKKLIERKKNGIWHFIFGKPGENGNAFIPVEMYIQGNVKIKCLRRTCGHWEILNYFPSVFQSEESESQTVQEKL
jgi:ribosomal protein L37AE/L43A